MSDTTVKYYDSTMSGAPALSGTAGALMGVLDACLVDGLGSVTVNSLVVASDVATATVSAGHQFTMQGNAGPVITIAGANPSGLNGEWRVTVTSTTVFTFATSGIGDQTATGTITAKRAPAGFSKSFSGTNKAAYRSNDILGTQLYLRVEDSTTTYATVVGYETMSDVDTGTNAFNTNWYIRKSEIANSGSRVWSLFADSRAFYLFTYWHSDYLSNSEAYWFGDIQTYRAAGDPYGCGLIANTSSSAPYPGGNATGQNEFYSLATGNRPAHALARTYTQAGTAVGFFKVTSPVNSALGKSIILTTVPEPMNNDVPLTEVFIIDGLTVRGTLPGLYSPWTNAYPNNNVVLDDVPNIGTLKFVRLGYGPGTDIGRAGINLTGPWR